MKLVYQDFCPFSRALRIALIEKDVDFSLERLNPWEVGFEKETIISPIGSIPAIKDSINGKNFSIISASASYEYVDEACDSDIQLYTNNPILRAEIRRIISWIDNDFFNKVSSKLIHEKIIIRIANKEFPNSEAIKYAFNSLGYQMDYLDFLTGKRRWLAGNNFTMADIVAGAHLSILDYLGDIHWDKYPNVKDWYSKLKSRPSFRELLEDKIGSIVPSKNYRNLDF